MDEAVSESKTSENDLAYSIGKRARDIETLNDVKFDSAKIQNAIIDLYHGEKEKALALHFAIRRINHKLSKQFEPNRANENIAIITTLKEIEELYSLNLTIQAGYAILGYLGKNIEAPDALYWLDEIGKHHDIQSPALTRNESSLSIDCKQGKHTSPSSLAFTASAVALTAVLCITVGMRTSRFTQTRTSEGNNSLVDVPYRLALQANCEQLGNTRLFIGKDAIRVSERISNVAFPAILKTDKKSFSGDVSYPQGTWKHPVKGKTPNERWLVFESQMNELLLDAEISESIETSYAEIQHHGRLLECKSTIWKGDSTDNNG